MEFKGRVRSVAILNYSSCKLVVIGVGLSGRQEYGFKLSFYDLVNAEVATSICTCIVINAYFILEYEDYTVGQGDTV